MRLRLLLLASASLLGACSKTKGPVRLDFVGTTGLTSGNRTVGAADTLNTRAYAEGTDADLTRLRVTVKYEPTRTPIIYPTPLNSYDPSKTPNDGELTYVDSVLTPGVLNRNGEGQPKGGAFLLATKFAARTTSGIEQWQYTATDANEQTATRLFRLTVRKADSAAVYHSYTIRFRPVIKLNNTGPNQDQLRDQALVFLNLHTGLLLPKYALINNSGSVNDGGTVRDNQQLVDLVCVARSTTSIALVAPASTQSLQLNNNTWPSGNRRSTQLRATTLNSNGFNSAVSTANFNDVFNGSSAFSPDSFSTGNLQAGQVIAFRVSENGQEYTGLLLVSGLVAGSSPVVTCQVKVQK